MLSLTALALFMGPTVIVESGDTLSEIGHEYGVTAEALADANGITLETIIYPGDELALPTQMPLSSPSAPFYAPVPVMVEESPTEAVTVEQMCAEVPSVCEEPAPEEADPFEGAEPDIEECENEDGTGQGLCIWNNEDGSGVLKNF